MTRTRFIADSMPEALAAARRELGTDMRVVHAAAHRTGGLWPFGRVVDAEVTVEVIAERGGAAVKKGATASPVMIQRANRPLRTSELRLRMAARLALARAVAAAHGAACAAADEVSDALNESASARVHGTPQVVEAIMSRLVARLRSQGLSDSLVDHVAARVQGDLHGEGEADEDLVTERFVRAVAALLPTVSEADAVPARAEGRPRVIAVVGPTGVGKTTTVAKIAADCRVRLGLRVGILAADAYRVGAVDQLHAYAQILGAPMRAADSPSAVRSAMLDLGWCDVILMDTAGRSHRDASRIAEIGSMLRAARPDDTHLVLSGASAARSLREAATAFHLTRPTRVVLSKLDECESPGTLVQAVRDTGCPVSWFTNGQDVPDDIERASAEAFARRVMQTPAQDAARIEVGV